MAVRWCFLGSHEVPEGDRMVTPPGDSSHICLPCSETARGQRLMQPVERTAGYRMNERAAVGKWSRIYAQLGRRKYKV